MELGFNHEQRRFDFAEGLGAARFEQVTGRRIATSTVEGADLIDPRLGPLSLKGPIGINSAIGLRIPITQQMVDGLGRSIIKDVQRNTFTRQVVVDTLRLSPAQKAALRQQLQNSLGGTNPAKSIFIVE